MSLYLFKPLAAGIFECTKLDDEGLPAQGKNQYTYTLRKRQNSWSCTCPAGVHRRKCKHPGFLAKWRRRPEGSRIGWAYNSDEDTFEQIMPSEEETFAALERLVSSEDESSGTPAGEKKLIDYRGIE